MDLVTEGDERMRTFLKRLAIGAALVLLAGCQCSHTYDGGAVTREAACEVEGVRTFTCTKCGESYEEAIPALSHRYEDRVTREPTYEREGERTFTCSLCKDRRTEPIPALEKPVAVSVTAKRRQESYFLNWVELDFTLENLGDQDIRGVKGNLIVRDIFGKEILSDSCSFTGELIPAGGSADFPEMAVLIDERDADDLKFFETDYEDLDFTYELEQVVFVRPEPEEETEPEEPVAVRMTGKSSIPPSTTGGRNFYYVQFLMYVYNNTDKDIRGIEGDLIVRDLFGEEVLVYPCDITGTIFSAHKKQLYSLAGLRVNEFSYGHRQVFNEEYEDLDFRYVIKSVLYRDGTREIFQDDSEYEYM